MANGADGSLIIDTELDNDGFKQGSDKLLSAVDNLAQQINRLGADMQRSFSGITSILQTLSAAAQQSASGVNQGAQQATQAAQQTTAAQAATAAATGRAAQAVSSYDKELAKLQKQIDAAKNKLADYYQEIKNIQANTDDWMGMVDGADSKGQINRILEIEQFQIDAVNQKYAAKIAVLEQLEAEYARVAAARDAANRPQQEPQQQGQTGREAHDAAQGIRDVSQAEQDAAQSSEQLGGSLRGVDSELRQKPGDAGAASGAFHGLRTAMNAVGNAAINAGRYLGRLAFNAVSKGINKAITSLKSFTNQAKKTTLSSNALVKSLTSVKRLLITRIKRMFISAIFNNIKEGIQQLAVFDSEFNRKMSNIKNTATQLSGNIAVSIGNIISAIEPVIVRLLELLSQVVSYLNQFFALLNGKKTYTAAKKGTQDYAEAATGAAKAQKEFNAELYGYDELTRQSKQSDNSGAGTEESPIQYEEIPVNLPDGVMDWVERLKEAWKNQDWYGVGQVIADGLNAALKVVDDWINNVLRPLGVEWARRVAEILNGLTDGVDWPLLGKTVADGLNAIADIVNTFLTTFRAKEFGQRVGQAIKSWFDNVEWDLIGQVFANKWNLLLHIIEGIVTTPGIWESIGRSIGTFIRSWFETIDINSLATSVIAILNGVTAMIRAFLEQNPFEGVAVKITSAINRVLHEVNWSELGKTLGDLFINVLHVLLEVVQGIDWQQLGIAIGQFLSGINWFEVFSTVANLIWEAVKAAINLIIGFLKGLGPEMIMAGILALIAIIAGKIAIATLFAPIISAIGTALAGIVSGIVAAIAGWPALIIAAAAVALAALILWIKNGGGEVIAGFFEGIAEAMRNVGQWIKEHIVDPVVNAVKDFFGIHSPSTVFAEIGRDLIRGLLNGIKEVWNTITEFFSTALSGLKNLLSTAWDNIKSTASTAWGNIKTGITNAFDKAKSAIDKTATQIKTGLSTAWGNIRSTASTAWENVRTSITNSFTNARTAVSTVASNMGSSLSTVWNGIRSNAQTAWSNLSTTTSSAFSTMRNNVVNAWNNLRTSLGNVQWNVVGHNLVVGLQNGISGAWGGLMSSVSNLVNGLINKVKSLFGVASPSKVFAEIGGFLDTGLENGLEGGKRGLLATAANIANAVTQGMTPDAPQVDMTADGVIGSMQAVISGLGAIAATFQTIADALTAAGGFTMPQIAAGTVAPYQTRVAETTPSEGDSEGVTAYLLGILSELQALSRIIQNNGDGETGDIRISINGREVFQAVVDENNRAIRRMGASPLKV